MSIRFKLLAHVVIVVTVACLLGVGLWHSYGAERDSDERADMLMAARFEAADGEAAMLRYMGSIAQVRTVIAQGETEAVAKEYQESQEHAELVQSHLAALSEQLEDGVASPEMATRLAQIDEQWAQVSTLSGQSVAAGAGEASIQLVAYKGAAPSTLSADEIDIMLENSEEAISESFGLFVSAVDREANVAAQLADDAHGRLNSLVIIGLCAIVALSVLVGIGLSTQLSQELSLAQSFATAVAGGDLHAEFGAHPGNEIGVVTRSVESMRDQLVQRVQNLREMAGVVLVTAERVDVATSDARMALAHVESDHPSVAQARAAAESAAQTAQMLNNLSKQMNDI